MIVINQKKQLTAYNKVMNSISKASRRIQITQSGGNRYEIFVTELNAKSDPIRIRRIDTDGGVTHITN